MYFEGVQKKCWISSSHCKFILPDIFRNEVINPLTVDNRKMRLLRLAVIIGRLPVQLFCNIISLLIPIAVVFPACITQLPPLVTVFYWRRRITNQTRIRCVQQNTYLALPIFLSLGCFFKKLIAFYLSNDKKGGARYVFY